MNDDGENIANSLLQVQLVEQVRICSTYSYRDQTEKENLRLF